jgi:O-acetyl-ADP-ribose deacetylase (regulator of RNase III)
MYSYWQQPQLTLEDIKLKIEHEESLTVEERRKRYRCQKYVTLEGVKPWSVDLEAFQQIEQSPPIEPLNPANALINQKVSHYTGNICAMEIDAIVNAANEALLGGGGIDGAIHSAAGDHLYNECKTIPKGESGDRCDCGAAKITRGYNLPAKFVIHTVGPRGQKEDMLRSAYNSVLQIVKEKKIRSVALCGISTGIFGYPLEAASRVACETVRTWLEDESNRNGVDRIIFITFLEKEKHCYNRLLQEYFPYTPDLEFVEAWKKDPSLFMERKETKEEAPVETPLIISDALKDGIVLAADHANLKHVEEVHDKSAPILPSVDKLLHEITEDHKLKHVEEIHDASAPVIPADAHVGQNQHGNLLNELTTTEHPLKHVEIVHDASAPVISADVHVGTNPLVAVLAEIKKPDDV